jgi:hypothetical protein
VLVRVGSTLCLKCNSLNGTSQPFFLGKYKNHVASEPGRAELATVHLESRTKFQILFLSDRDKWCMATRLYSPSSLISIKDNSNPTAVCRLYALRAEYVAHDVHQRSDLLYILRLSLKQPVCYRIRARTEPILASHAVAHRACCRIMRLPWKFTARSTHPGSSFCQWRSLSCVGFLKGLAIAAVLLRSKRGQEDNMSYNVVHHRVGSPTESAAEHQRSACATTTRNASTT